MAARARAHECCSFLNFLRRETIVNTLYEYAFFFFYFDLSLVNRNFSETELTEDVFDVSRGWIRQETQKHECRLVKVSVV